ncbi:lamin tail domain-containing protein, partial [Myxococcota bacterium]|nr:lamin tail domain-containing protein [Myxococcota bacterium]
MMLRALAVAALVSVPALAEAQVLITEVQPNPTSTNDDGEWVEVQNTGAAMVAIGGWTLGDYTGTSDPAAEVLTRWAFPAGTVLGAGEVIVVAKFAGTTAAGGDGYSANLPAGLYSALPTFELGSATHDDGAVPNLTAVGGTQLWAIANSATGDAVVLRDELGNLVDAVEWGTLDRNVPGAPFALAPASAESLRRVATTGSSAVDFIVAATPDPFVGLGSGPVSQPPLVTLTTLVPRHYEHLAALDVSTNATDADGVASVSLHSAIATSSTGPAATGYLTTAMTAAGNTYSAQVTPSTGPAPATFHDRYVRVYVEATDTTAASTVDPSMASPAPTNTHYYWRNVLPPGESSIAAARELAADGSMRWIRHSVRVRGVALTSKIAFVGNTTNFFIQSETSGDAIRVFARSVVPQDVLPGDVVRVTGMLDSFNGLRQLGEPEVAVEILSTGGAVPESTHTIADLLANGEALESQLVRVDAVSFVTPQATWPTNGNVDITDGTGTITVRVTSLVTSLSGQAAPAGAFGIRGILGQFAASGVGGYQILPRDANDLFAATSPTDAGVGLDASAPDAAQGQDAAVRPD